MKRKNSTRREFLAGVAATGTVGALSGCVTTGQPADLSAAAPGVMAKAVPARRVLGANDRIQCGFIGIGSRGTSLLASVLHRKDVDVAAVCDIHDIHLAQALEMTRANNPEVRSYIRFEDLLEKEKLDCIVTATPDHIHAPVILGAFDCGMDVYTEKPMTLTWQSAQAIRDRARETGAVVQVGTQLRSMSMYQKAREVYQSGGLGKLVAVQVMRNSGRGGYRHRLTTVEQSSVHWDLFLRDTKPYPFDPQRFLNWRRYVEYSNGAAGDLMMHHLDIFHFITGCGMPERVMSVGGLYALNDGRTCPDTIGVLLEYPEKFQFNYTTTYVSGRFGLLERYMGTEGALEIRDMSDMTVYSGDRQELVKSPGVFNEPHLDDFFACMRSRKPTIAPVEAGCQGSICCHMAVLSEQTGESIKWDAANQRVV